MIPKTILSWALVVLLGITLAMGVGFYWVGKAHKAAAIEFWGDDYDPDEAGPQIDWGFFGNIIMPQGGPMVSPEFANVCTDTPLPLVPIKVDADGDGQVLCGLGPNSMVMGFSVNKIDDAEFREAFKKAIRSEFD